MNRSPSVPPDAPSTGGLVLLASYPKSGNTWLRSLLTAVAAPGRDVDLGALIGANTFIDRRWVENESGLDPAVLPLDLLDVVRSHLAAAIDTRDGRPTLVKTHATAHAFTNRRRWSRPPGRAIVIVRHPYDIAVSYAHFVSRTVDRTVRTLGHSGAVIDPPGLGHHERLPESMGSWAEHVGSWLDAGCETLLVRYEDLQLDVTGSLAKVLEFIGMSPSVLTLTAASEAAAFDRLRQTEGNSGFGHRPSDAAPMFRSGRTGEGRDVLTTDQREALQRTCGDVMKRLGYLGDGRTTDRPT